MVVEAATVRFTPQPDESSRASRLMHPRLWLLIRLPPLIAFLLGLILIPLLGWSEAVPYVLFLWAMGLLLLGFDLLVPIISRRQVVRRNPQLFDTETVITVDGDGLHHTRGAGSGVRGWSGITDYIENDEFIVLRDGHLAVAVVPKRAFRDAQDQHAFVSVVVRHLPAPPR